MTKHTFLMVGVLLGAITTVPAAPAAQGTAAAKQTAPKASALPAAVEAAFKKEYPNATIKHVSREREAGKLMYEVESIDNGMRRDLMYAPDGTVISYEEQIAESDVPAAVTSAIKARYPKATFSRCEKLFKDGKMLYEIQLKGAKVKEVEVTPEGQIVAPK